MSQLLQRLQIAAAPLCLSLATLALLAYNINPLDHPSASDDPPGLTSDETFNLRQGVDLAVSLRQYGLGMADPASIREIFAPPRHLPDHPPLGRWVLGFSHDALRSYHGADDQTVHLAWARMGSAVLFSLTVFAVGCAAGRWYGMAAGAVAALSLMLTPRLFGHAHLAALETCIGLTFTLTVLHLAARWNRDCPHNRVAAVTGLLLGLALLSKIQAVLLPPLIVVVALLRWRIRGIRPLGVCGATAAAVFFAGWPWLWLNPLHNTWTYFGRATERISVRTWYLGEALIDTHVPWHYPWVMFAATLPAAYLVLGLMGLVARGRLQNHAAPTVSSELPTSSHTADNQVSGWREAVVGLAIVGVLLLFSIPGTAVYDGVRLFLVIFPLWSILVARGAVQLEMKLRLRWGLTPIRRAGVRMLLAVVLITPAWQLAQIGPCYLSFYNELCGGVAGAERHGLELNYWGDAMSARFMRQIPDVVDEASTIDVVPVAHPAFLAELQTANPQLAEHRIQLRPLDHRQWDQVRYVLSFRRMADLPPFLRDRVEAQPLLEVRRDGVRLSALHRINPALIDPDAP